MGTALAQNPDPMDIRACSAIETDAQRLACYDKATGRTQMETANRRQDRAAAGSEVVTRAAPASHDVDRAQSLLDSRWELSPESKLGTMNLRGYRPTYVLPYFVTSNQNQTPHSPAPDHTVETPAGLQNAEMKFQLSLKTKVWQGVFGDQGDLWVGYTQSSRWQVYNKELSRPFRETNYEPEAMLVFNTNYQIFGWTGRMAGISLTHQSNGRSDPLSRSWNRVIADVGFEREGWTVMLRPWWRIPEDRKTDDNPDISNYMGRGEVQIVREWGANEFALAARHSFRSGADSHGSLRFTWSFPLVNNLRGFMEVFNGYGESMIDYNHHATYLGLGVSLLDWY
ncbi:phospholipase A [Luteibacter sp. Sphag1AF]|uniref:phospholipase A n=1 Tax=Luteibacter sp. Sphag1AF TaxID=2587031 RepID=UPI002106E8DC|nr:phospholipase A [Luteibacter sp. Sphag1AF]